MGRGFESRASYLELARGEGLQPGRWEGKRKRGFSGEESVSGRVMLRGGGREGGE